MPKKKYWHTAEYQKELYDKQQREKLERAKGRIGARTKLLVGPARFDAVVLDVERKLGVIQYHVKPARGTGKAWLCRERLRFGQ